MPKISRRVVAAATATVLLAAGAAAVSAPAGASTRHRAPALLGGLLGDKATPLAATFDSRAVTAANRPDAATRNAVRSLLSTSGPGARATWDSRFGTLRSLRGSTTYLTGPTAGAAVDVARGWLSSHAAAFSLTKAQVAALKVDRDHALPGTGTHTITFAEAYAGIESVQGGRLNVAVTKDGRILAYTGNPTPGTSVHGSWTSSPAAALSAVAGKLAKGVAFTPHKTGTVAGYTTFARGPFAGTSYVKQAIFGTRSGPVAAYHVFFIKGLDRAWDTVVNASTDAILFRASVVAHDSDPADPTDAAGQGLRQLPRRAEGRHRTRRLLRRNARIAEWLRRPERPGRHRHHHLRQQRVDLCELVQLRRAGRPGSASDRPDR